MSDRKSLCWRCIRREGRCAMFAKNPDFIVIKCGRFLMPDADKAFMQMLHQHSEISELYKAMENEEV